MAEIKSPHEYEFKKDYLSDWDIHRQYVQTFDPYEAMLMGQVYDSVSGSIDGSKITDGYAATLAKERADRVIAKLPEGQTEGSKADAGKAAFMDIIRQKWVYPNANAQHPFLEKLNMWQLYSSVYGYMPMFYDWNVASSGYIGPDCWLWSPRNLVPQQGKTSLEDMEYVTALTWVGKRFLKEKYAKALASEDNDGWNVSALKELLDRIDNRQSTSVDYHKDTKVTRDRQPQGTKRGICLATRYESGPDGEWVIFTPDHGCIELRRIKNPHKNGRIPFVIKYSQPLFDNFYGLGDFQRAMPLQFARDGLTNFYFKGIKMNLIPPIIANANGVMKHTLDYREGAVMLETIPNSIRRLETSTAGLATYKDAQANLTGSLLSLYGSQNAASPGAETLNPSQGKTPQAINLYNDKEATRDGAERRRLGQAIERLTDGFNSLIVNISTESIPISLFSQDIEDIRKAGLIDVLDMFKGNFQPDKTLTGGELKIDPKKLKGVEYRFNINPDSTMKVNKDAQRQSVTDAIGMIGKMQNVFQDDPRLDIHWDKIMASYEALSDVPGASEWISFNENGPTKHDLEMQKQQQEQAAAAQQQPSPNSVTMPNGQVHEQADLVKMYSLVEDLEGKNAIREAMGLPPLAELPPTPVVSQTGHAFHDPTLAAAADALHASIPGQDTPMPAAEAPAETPEPIVNKSGQMFKDKHLSQAADAITNLK